MLHVDVKSRSRVAHLLRCGFRSHSLKVRARPPVSRLSKLTGVSLCGHWVPALHPGCRGGGVWCNTCCPLDMCVFGLLTTQSQTVGLWGCGQGAFFCEMLES